MNETNFYLKIKNHFNETDVEKAQRRRDEIQEIVDDLHLEFENVEEWDSYYPEY